MNKRKRMLFIALCILIIFTTTGASVLVEQTNYNCFPASVEMLYKLYSIDTITQHDVRDELPTSSGVVPSFEIDDYMYEHFDIEDKYLCCVDTLIMSVLKAPVLLTLNGYKLDRRNYTGHCVVAIDVKYEDGTAYIQVLDPDGGRVLWYSANKLYYSTKGWNNYFFIVRGVKNE